MSVHQYNPNRKPDSDFIKGDITFLCEGNKCRLLDGRRTPGYIEDVDYESGLFKWTITDFEDKGNHWIVPFENVKNYQFEKDSNLLSSDEKSKVQDIITEYDQPLTIRANDEHFKATEGKIELLKVDAIQWLKDNSTFLSSGEKLDYKADTGSEKLSHDLIQYLKEHELEEHETITADLIVLNPNSGEWIKGMSILLAEMGLVSFHGKVTRTKDIFTGLGAKDLREKYILHRLAFIRALFSLLAIEDVPLYRGMCSEFDWRASKKTFVSFTFNDTIAKSFSGFEDDQFRNAYFVKSAVPISKIFMTYLETSQMNERYKESEALLFNTLNITF